MSDTSTVPRKPGLFPDHRGDNPPALRLPGRRAGIRCGLCPHPWPGGQILGRGRQPLRRLDRGTGRSATRQGHSRRSGLRHRPASDPHSDRLRAAGHRRRFLRRPAHPRPAPGPRSPSGASRHDRAAPAARQPGCRGGDLRPHPPAAGRSAGPVPPHPQLATPGRLSAGHHRRRALDRHRTLPRRRHVLGPRRHGYLPALAHRSTAHPDLAPLSPKENPGTASSSPAPPNDRSRCGRTGRPRRALPMHRYTTPATYLLRRGQDCHRCAELLITRAEPPRTCRP